jgi:hypothetical protein
VQRLAVAVVVGLVVASLGAPIAAAAPVGPGPRIAPKVALIVGPAGGVTESYRAMARDAARTARQYTPNIVEVYSPYATWPAVARAIEGASIVVYLGHGNGWPSRYRDSLAPTIHDGFGLNPVAGVDDSAHQYFGEASLDKVQLAPDAVVLLHHLCYASGNSEPGLPEGTLDQSIQRVDNYAAGFIRAGASAVIAEGHFDPAWYVKQLLASTRSVRQVWESSPSRKGHQFMVASVRSPGFTARLDPDRQTGGFYRSLVARSTVRTRSIPTSDGGRIQAAILPTVPSLVDLGLEFRTPLFNKLPIAGITAELSLPVAGGGARLLPRELKVGVRWDPIQLATPPAQPATTAANGATPTRPPASPGSQDPTATPVSDPAPDARPADPPDVTLVVPEAPGSVVEPTAARITMTRVAIRLRFPATPGLYRLVPTLHAGDGVAYDIQTQQLVTPVLVKVGGPLSAAYGVVSDLTVARDQQVALPVRVANTGLQAWAVNPPPGDADIDSPDVPDRRVIRRLQARLVGTWVSTIGASVPGPVDGALSAGGSQAGRQEVVTLQLTAPAATGSYLLILDVATPEHGTLSANGSPPAIVRVTVLDPVSEAPIATPTAPAVREGL